MFLGKPTVDIVCLLPEQLRVDEGDDVLQELEGGANQKVGSKGFDEGA